MVNPGEGCRPQHCGGYRVSRSSSFVVCVSDFAGERVQAFRLFEYRSRFRGRQKGREKSLNRRRRRRCRPIAWDSPDNQEPPKNSAGLSKTQCTAAARTRPAMIQPNFASRRCATHGNSSESLGAARNAACGKRPWRQAIESPDDLDTQPPGGEFDALDFAGNSAFRIAAALARGRLRCCRNGRQIFTAFPLRTDWVSF